MKKNLFILATLFGSSVVLSVASAETKPEAQAQSQSAKAVSAAASNQSVGTPVKVEINKGVLVKFSAPASSVVIADPAMADVQVVSPKTVFLYGKKIGETSLTAIDSNDDIIFQSVVQVTHNLSSLERAVKRVAPDAKVSFRTVDGGLVIDGSASSVQESEHINNIASTFVGAADKVVNMVTTGGGDQVMLQVKIVEMARSDLKTFGINLRSSVTGGGIVSQVVNGTLDTSSVISRSTGANTNILTSVSGGGMTISSLVDLLETQGLATVLAEPSLTTATGKAASFLAGGQYPIPVAGQNGTVTVQYQPFGVSLNFTPVVMSNDRMSILVNPEVSTLNFSNPIQVSGFNYPILDTRKAQATVELGSGQTFVLAGLLRNDTSNNVTKLPGAGDIPILGALFRSQRFQNNQTELVILVTPYIVHPVSEAKKMQTPIDGYKPPSDMERLMLGSLYQQQDMDENKAVNAKSSDKYGEEVILEGSDEHDEDIVKPANKNVVKDADKKSAAKPKQPEKPAAKKVSENDPVPDKKELAKEITSDDLKKEASKEPAKESAFVAKNDDATVKKEATKVAPKEVAKDTKKLASKGEDKQLGKLAPSAGGGVKKSDKGGFILE